MKCNAVSGNEAAFFAASESDHAKTEAHDQ